MNSSLDLLTSLVSWLGRNSLQACLLIGLILALQAALRDRLAPRWRYALWLILVAKLALPWSPPSPLSVYNLLPYVSSQAALPSPMASATSEAATDPAMQSVDTDAALVTPPSPSPAAHPTFWQALRGDPARSTALAILPIVWLAGALLMLLAVILQALQLRGIHRQRFVTDQAALDLLEDCKQQMRTPAYLALVETSRVRSPALFGFLRPRLLLPAGSIASLGPKRLGHVFLHELAHLKRHDILINWVLAVLQILHWFNPLVWYAFARMRNERELACDALALSHDGAPDPHDYGRTIVDLLETFVQPHRQPALAGVLEDKTCLARRITMIARYHRSAHAAWSLPATALLLLLAAVTLTNAQTSQPHQAATTAAAQSQPVATGPVNDHLLTDRQRSFMESEEQQFADVREADQYTHLADSARTQQLEAQWLAALNNPRSPNYLRAISGLGAIGSKKAVVPLLRIATSRPNKPNQDRWRATRALGLIGQSSAVPQLIPLLYHYNQDTHMYAQISLVRLTGQNFADDWQAWTKWWNEYGGQPRASLQKVAWPEPPSDD